MRGHIILEERFLHQGIDHHLFVTKADGAENEYRFEVRRLVPGEDKQEAFFEKTEDFTMALNQGVFTLEQLLKAELAAIKQTIIDEEEIHVHDP